MKKTIVISAINLFEGGPLSILQDCLEYLDKNLYVEFNIVAFVHNKSLFKLNNITLFEVLKSRKSYIYRLYYEYIWFYFKSKELQPYLWFSLHDITPNVKAQIRAVYCHNPSPFYKITLREFFIEPSLGYFNKFYKFLYLINLNKNKYIVVQQNWLREKFKNEFKSKAQIVVAYPTINNNNHVNKTVYDSKRKIKFFFPAFPRVFKNFECACEAAEMLLKKGLELELILTISGTENKYSKYLLKKYGNISGIVFLGSLKRERVFEIYQECDVIVFPSKLETWGLPITEAKEFSKPVLIADLPYAHETVGNYKKVSFFDPTNSNMLASLMEKFIMNNIKFDENTATTVTEPFTNSWAEIFVTLLK